LWGLEGGNMIAIADPSPMMRRWLRMGVASRGDTVLEVGDGAELLELLADGGRFEVVVASCALPVVHGEQVLAMLRTVGDRTPFILIAPFCRESVRALVGKLGRAAVVEDPLDGVELLRVVTALVNECDELTQALSEPPFPVRPAKVTAKDACAPPPERRDRRAPAQCPRPRLVSRLAAIANPKGVC
jgi:DNA-binding response OmpR family regulator